MDVGSTTSLVLGLAQIPVMLVSLWQNHCNIHALIFGETL
jgi:hypothetical protein